MLPPLSNSDFNIISGNYQFNFSEPAMRARFNIIYPTRVPADELRRGATPNG